MLQDIYGQAQRQITTDKFFALSGKRQSELLEKLQELILLTIRSIILESCSLEDKNKLEVIVQHGSDDDLFQFGYQQIVDFDVKLSRQIKKIISVFYKEIHVSA